MSEGILHRRGKRQVATDTWVQLPPVLIQTMEMPMLLTLDEEGVTCPYPWKQSRSAAGAIIQVPLPHLMPLPHLVPLPHWVLLMLSVGVMPQLSMARSQGPSGRPGGRLWPWH